MKENMELLREKSQKLESLRKQRQSLTNDLYQGLEQSEKLYQGMNVEGLKTADSTLSKLDQGLEQYGSFNGTIADLSTGLTDSLGAYVQFAAESKNYRGWEKLVRLFSTDSANRMRVTRLKEQGPRENLKMILDYGEQLYDEIINVREDALSSYARLQTNVDIIVTKISEYEPQEAALKEKLDALTEAYAEMENKYNQAEASEQAKLVEEKENLYKQLTNVRNEHDQVLTIYNQAQQAYQGNIQSRDAFEKMVRDLGIQATMIKEKIDNVTDIYMAAPEAVKIMMTTKGMESLDKAVNVATDQSIDIITQSAQSVSDATMARAEIQLIDEQVMRGYMNRMEDTMKTFNERYDKVRQQAKMSQQERYGDSE
ncbi:MAG: hypothetical protein OEZ68_18215 [Gammaproteobacteria bacterium]|nr:hypothetical protein [Gammaproteobacteria bacterium]MDH5802741.1 hypothetical protein [Gammaproteobacteria bacterium]